MTKRILDYDPLSRTTTYHEYDALTDTSIISEVQDIEPFLQTAHELRKDDDYTRNGIRGEMWHYGHIPNIIVQKMLIEDGVDVFNKHQTKEVMKLLNTKYSICKTTRKRHS